MLVKNLALTATRRFMTKRMLQSPEAQWEFWERQITRYSNLLRLSGEMAQSIEWRYPGHAARQLDSDATPSAWKTTLLNHLPCVELGMIEPAGIYTFKIHGDVAFRDQPAELVEQAKHAREIHLDIDTAGGDGSWALEFGARLRSIGAPIIATAQRAYSAGSILLQAAHVRRITTSGTVLVHGPQYALFGSAEEFEQAAKMMRNRRPEYVELYAMRTGQPVEVVEQWLTKDHYFNPEESVAAGLCDEIIPDKPE